MLNLNSNGLKHSWASSLISKFTIYFLYIIIIILYSNIINGAPSSSLLSSSSSSSSSSLPSLSSSSSSSSSSSAEIASASASISSGKKTIIDGKYKINILNPIDGSDTNYTNLTRQHDGDIFSANDITKCNLDTCVGLSSGTASLLVPENKKSDISIASTTDDSNLEGCTCRCHSYLSTYREDLGICVDDIRECTLSPFISGSSSEKIPFVFLPLRGQIIYPSREISFAEIQTPICAVTGSQYLTSNGWADLRNPIDTDLPFRMFRDEGRTFLQWLGEPELRHKMQGRLVLIHLLCRDMSFSNNKSTLNNDPNSNLIGNNIFTPCVAFRINGSPVTYINNVSEVLFQSEASSNLSAVTDGLSAREYIVIGVCSLLLGLIYVASVFLYLHVKKRKNLSSEPARSSIDDLDNDINYPKNDQVTFGVPFTRTGSSYSVNSINDQRNSQRSHTRSLNSPVSGLKEDIGVIKNNPLLKHFPSLSDHSGFTSDLSNSNSEFEDTHSSKNEKIKINQTAAVVHPISNNKIEMERNPVQESSPSPTQENECLPEANVSIIEEVGSEEKQLENMRALVNGTVRKKLYFNPAYFEPHLLLSPPPAAIEFLTKIREVIAIAKYKMASKRYQPSLGAILEENRTDGSEISSKRNHQYNMKQMVNYVKMDETRKLQSSGIIKNTDLEIISNNVNNNKNIGDKANSIQKWLETVPPPNETFNKSIKQNQNSSASNLNAIQSNENSKKISKDVATKIEEKQEINRNIRKLSPPKQKPPPIPDTIPRSGIYSTNPKTMTIPQEEINEFSNSLQKMSSLIAYHQEKPITPVLIRHHFDTNPIYQYTDARAEIYNNPKFNHTDSPQPSQKSRSTRSKSSRKRMEVLDQYSNPQKLEPSHYELMKNIKQMPDMVYEALAKDYSMGMFTSSSRPNSQTFSIPTPDYDSTLDKKIKNIYNNSQNGSINVPSVPTPDYSTLGKRSNGRMYQPPDSPIYRRKSPQYLIVDYETDSLERTTHQNRKCSNSSSPTSNNSSEASSQPSPSLSTALPLEEEVEIRNTVYDKMEGFRKDGDIILKKKIQKSSSEYEDLHSTNGKKKLEPLIKYDTPFRGSMTIEVQHEPLSDFEPSTDSDQFEPDTLDRKPKKHSFCDVKNDDAWSEHLKKSKNFVNSAEEKISYSSLENMTSLPDFSNNFCKNDSLKNCLVLKSSSSFRSNIETVNKRTDSNYDETDHNLLESRPSFGSLREIYQSKAHRNPHQRPKLTNVDFNSEQGRILTLEAKHSRRQRQIQEKDKNSKILPPDVVPTTANNVNSNTTSSTNSSDGSKGNGDVKNYYDIKKMKKNSTIVSDGENESNKLRKNFQGWNTDNFSGNHNGNIVNNNIKNNPNTNNNNNNKIKQDQDYYSHDETEETTSNHSESTEITGVSDTQGNSEFEDDNISKEKSTSFKNTKHKGKFRKNFIVNLPITNNNNEFNSNNNTINSSAIHKNSPINSSGLTNLKNLSLPNTKQNKHTDLSGDFSYDRYLNRKRKQEFEKKNENFLKSEIPSIDCKIPETSVYAKDLMYPDQNSNIKQVYHVEIESPMNGMQIAMGLKDRSKKSKDLKNAWKRFVCLATSKLNPSSPTKLNENSDLNINEKKLSSNFILDNELIKNSILKKTEINTQNQQKTNNKFLSNRYNPYDQNQFNFHQKHELDSGYMSADSSEVYARRYYERYNFKAISGAEHIIMIDTIADNSDENHDSIEENKDNDKNFNKLDSNSNKNIKNNNNNNDEDPNLNCKIKLMECSNSKQNNNLNNDNKNIDNRQQCHHHSHENEYNNYIEDENVVVTASESDDDGGNTEDLSESGAESIETHSVFFKNIRKKP